MFIKPKQDHIQSNELHMNAYLTLVHHITYATIGWTCKCMIMIYQRVIERKTLI